MSLGLVWLVEDNRRTPLPAGWEPLRSHRFDEAWTWRQMTKRRVVADDDMSGVVGGSLTMGVYDDTRWKGSLSWAGLESEMPAWRDILVQPVHSVELGDGKRVEWEMGVYLCHTPAATHAGDGLVSVEVNLHDLTLTLRRAKLLKDSGVFGGTQVVPHVRSLIDFHGGGLLTTAIEDSDATLPATLTWEAGTSILTIINALLATIGYEGLYADMQGVLRSAPYVAPGDRPIVWEFTAGGSSVFTPGRELTRDDFDTPNRVSLLTQGEGDGPGLRAVATLDDLAPGHPLSQDVSGQYVDRVETVEADNQATLQGLADRMLLEGITTSSTLRVEHAPVPIGPHSRVATDLIESGTVQTMSIDCESGAHWTTTLREVIA